jgi:2-amino-4-hydroxy-6-hydroxymethyldihydropteridine diphosphokinase
MGSNLGQRQAILERAVSACAKLGQLLAVSALYETAPAGGPPQPDFLNAALRIRTHLTADGLLGELQRIELALGRRRTEHWGPRTLDLDILWIRSFATATSRLTVPHPRLWSRPFALVPLVEVAPDATDPVSGTAYAALGASPHSSGLRRLAGSTEWALSEQRLREPAR